MVLLINACTRPQSRTLYLATKAVQTISGNIEMLSLYDEDIKPLDYDELSKRDSFIEKSDFSDTMFRFAKQFSEADEIVAAAQYWDLSFPAIYRLFGGYPKAYKGTLRGEACS